MGDPFFSVRDCFMIHVDRIFIFYLNPQKSKKRGESIAGLPKEVPGFPNGGRFFSVKDCYFAKKKTLLPK